MAGATASQIAVAESRISAAVSRLDADDLQGWLDDTARIAHGYEALLGLWAAELDLARMLGDVGTHSHMGCGVDLRAFPAWLEEIDAPLDFGADLSRLAD